MNDYIVEVSGHNLESCTIFKLQASFKPLLLERGGGGGSIKNVSRGEC